MMKSSLGCPKFITRSYKKHPILRMLSMLSAIGYAFPGAVLAIGLVSFAGGVDTFGAWLGINNNILIGLAFRVD